MQWVYCIIIIIIIIRIRPICCPFYEFGFGKKPEPDIFSCSFLPQSPPPMLYYIIYRRVCAHMRVVLSLHYTPPGHIRVQLLYNIEYTTDLSVCGLGAKKKNP